VGVHHVVTALADHAVQPEQGAQFGVAGHAEVAHLAAVGTDHVRDRAGVVQRDHVGVVPGVLQDRPELKFGAPDAEPGDQVQDFHC